MSLETLVLVLMGAGYGLEFSFIWLLWLNQKAPDAVKESWGPVARLGRWGLMAVFVVALVPMLAWPVAAAAAGVFPGAQLDNLQDALVGSHDTKTTMLLLTFVSSLPVILAKSTGFADTYKSTGWPGS